jgi:hypothetical protein
MHVFGSYSPLLLPPLVIADIRLGAWELPLEIEPWKLTTLSLSEMHSRRLSIRSFGTFILAEQQRKGTKTSPYGLKGRCGK